MRVITAPDKTPICAPSVFLAGGISACADWQEQIIVLLRSANLTLINPRREAFDLADASVSAAQIAWEYRRLREASAVLFWFPPETLCPITLFELGGALERAAPVFVGCDPGYAHRTDVILQTALARPDIRVADTLAGLAAQITDTS